MSDFNSSPVLNISLGDSFLADQSFNGTENDEDFFKSVDERINSKIALGMKKAVGLIVHKFSDIIHQKQ